MRYRLPNDVSYEIDDPQRRVETRFPDGDVQAGVPDFAAEHVARARTLGYQGSDEEVVWAMTRDHDLLHSVVALNIDSGESHALRWSTRGVQERGRIPAEERLVFLLQRALNVSSADELLADYRD